MIPRIIPKRGPGIAMSSAQAQFAVGQVVQHKLFNYRGVIVDVDPQFQGQTKEKLKFWVPVLTSLCVKINSMLIVTLEKWV